ncbi:MAG: CAP domain-containing protein [Nitrospiraceae bacterium]|jgi:uncharacterized protein YkwD|nr:CAP domain-containing protein [Nitrospiraceae bacterium]
MMTGSQRNRCFLIAGIIGILMLSMAGPGIAADLTEAEKELALIINSERAARNLPLLRLHDRLSHVAWLHSTDMAERDTLTHDSPGGGTARERLENNGYEWTAYGEIIGREHSGSARDMVNIWLKSPPHATIMLSPDYAEFGVAAAHKRGWFGTWYWTVVFGSPTSRQSPHSR